MSFVRVLLDSFRLLKMCPRFFIPKIVVSFLFFPIIVLVAIYFIKLNMFSPVDLSTRSPVELTTTLMQLLFLLVYIILVYVIDSFMVNPMYPLLVEQYYKTQSINFRRAFIGVIQRFKVIFPSLIIFSIALFVVIIPVTLIAALARFMENELLFYLSLSAAVISIFAMLILFYLIYPVSSLEKIDLVKVLKQTVLSSLKHKGDVTLAVLVSLAISTLSLVIAGAIVITNNTGQPLLTLLLFLLLVATRFLIAIFAAYQYVLNAVFYLGFEKGVFLGKK